MNPTTEFIVIPVVWVKGTLGLIGVMGMGMGIFSLIWPQNSIQLYQWMMLRFHWRVEPIHPVREIRNTRILGLALSGLSLLIVILLYCNSIATLLQLIFRTKDF